MSFPRSFALAVTIVALTGCGSEPRVDILADAGSDSLSAGADVVCNDGQTVLCDCPDGVSASAVCRGGVWSECLCAPIFNPGEDAAADAATDDVADALADAEVDAGADSEGDIDESDAPELDVVEDSVDTLADADPADALADTDSVDAADIDSAPDADVNDPTDVADTSADTSADSGPSDAAVDGGPSDTSPTDTSVVDASVDVVSDASDSGVADTALDTSADTSTDVAPDVVEDPCTGIPEGGRCISESAYEVCITFSGTGRRIVRQENCDPDEICGVVDDAATCVPDYICRDGQTRCADETVLEVCAADAWVPTPCAEGCEVIIGGAQCAEPVVESDTIDGRLLYETLVLASDRLDWAADSEYRPAPQVLAVLYDGGVQLDYTYTAGLDSDDPGSFSLPLPEVENGDEVVVFFTVNYDSNGRIRSAVASPNASATGEIDVQAFLGGASRRSAFFWQWSASLDRIRELGDLGVSISGGSGALAIHDSLIRTNALLAEAVEEPVPNQVIWYAQNASFSCGACAVEYPAQLAGNTFENQVMIGGGSDYGVFATPVTVHEIGHVVMSHYGTSPGEGGIHYLGIPQHPGLAWSEGWATGFSSLAREDSLYYSKQGGGMFWFDIAARQYGFSVPWRRPVAANGLFQRVDENEVATMVYEIGEITGLDSLIDILGAPRINNPPYARGYTTRYWETLNASGEPLPYVDTRRPAPMFADFADALVCNGDLTAAQINGVTNPSVNYPYDGNSPNCAVSPQVNSPLQAELDRAVLEQNGALSLEVALTRHAPGLDVDWSVDLPAGVTLLASNYPGVIPGEPVSDEVRLQLELQVSGTPATDLVIHLNAGDGVSWGWHTPLAWRFGRPAPTIPTAQFANESTTLWGIPMGRPVVTPMVPVP